MVPALSMVSDFLSWSESGHEVANLVALGMTYLRAETAQIDAWERMGNKGWNWDSLMPYYKKSEYFESPYESQVEAGAAFDPASHGTEGPLTVGWAEPMGNIAGALKSTFGSLGLPFNTDPNNGSMRGFNIFPKTLDRQSNVREDAGRAYFWPIAKRPNLDIFVNSFVERMVWEPVVDGIDPIARGVVFVNSTGSRTTILANREIILSAGALRSPLILEHSGVGNPAILKKNGIEVVVDLPFVGENLQDQTTSDMFYTSNATYSGNAGYASYFNAQDIFGNNTAAFAANVSSSIKAYAQQYANYSGIVSAHVTERLFQMQYDLIFEQGLPISEILVSPGGSGSVTVEYWGLLPFSRGNIHINSINASAPASINPNYFMLDYDIQQQTGTAKMGRVIANTEPLASMFQSETTPSLATVPENASDAEWAEWLKSTYRSNFHYISTAAMMPKELGGVVDSELLVYGTQNVRVVDASVIPFQVCGHLTSTLYAVAEKAADMIKARYA